MLYPNINKIFSMLNNKYSMSESGIIFFESLANKKLDLIAYFNYVDASNTLKVKKVQSTIIANLKPALLFPVFSDYQFNKVNVSNLNISNSDSLLGLVDNILNRKGESAFEDIALAVIKGSDEYLKKVPIALYMTSHQFKEYNLIKKELRKIV